jgi:putative ABC transport system permease protein
MIDVNVEDAVRATPGGIAAVRDRIQQVIRGEHRAFIYTNTEYRKWVLDLINGFFVINYMQTAVAVIIAALGIVNTLIISVTERRRELGVLRAVGGLRRQIGRMIMPEAAVMAVVGVISGTLAGMMNTLFLVRTAASMVGGFTIPFRFPVGMILLALPLTILISLLAAGGRPARRSISTWLKPLATSNQDADFDRSAVDSFCWHPSGAPRGAGNNGDGLPSGYEPRHQLAGGDGCL